MPPTNWDPCFTCQQPAALQVIPRWKGHNDARPTRLLRPIPRSLNTFRLGAPSKIPKGWRADRGVRGGDGTPNQGPARRVQHRRAPIIGADLPPKIVVVVVAVAIAVVIVVASIPVEVEAPFRAPEFPRAPVVQRRRAKTGLGLGGTRRQPQTSAHQHRRCKPYDSSFHDYFNAPRDALGGFVLTWPGSYKSLGVASSRSPEADPSVVVRVVARLAQEAVRDAGSARRNHPREWITQPPRRCPNGHTLGPNRVLVGQQARLGHGGGHTAWTCRTCDQTVYGLPLNTQCTCLDGAARVRISNVNLIDTGGGPISVTRRTRNLVGACRSSPAPTIRGA
ncbi:MAG: hypothetical protein QOC76_1872 [Mycobacterium sp.]|jgi:hypothetical protein|nr:hypothetical protein [Mycobacterium sp.]